MAWRFSSFALSLFSAIYLLLIIWGFNDKTIFIGGLLYYPTNGYGTVIALALALIVLVGQKMLLTQANKDFADMYQAQALFEKTQNDDYLRFIMVRSAQMLKDNKVLSDKAKNEIHKLQAFSQGKLEK